MTKDVKNNVINNLNVAKDMVDQSSIEKLSDEFLISFQEIHSLDQIDLKKRISDFFKQKKNSLIYVIELMNTDRHKMVFEAFSSAKTQKANGCAYSKLNDQISDCIYVGSSLGKNLNARIKNHFGLGSKGVYSLHLLNWFPRITQGELKISLFNVSYPEHNSKILNITELFEQGLWDIKNPMFGKRSGLL